MVPSDPPSLGLALQWAPLSSTEDVWHIFDVIPNSPADLAGLLPYGDYIIGSPEGIVRGEAGLGELVEDVSRSDFVMLFTLLGFEVRKMENGMSSRVALG